MSMQNGVPVYTEPVPREMIGVAADAMLQIGLEQAEKDLASARDSHPEHIGIVEEYLAAVKGEMARRGLPPRRVYPVTPALAADLRNRFTYHAPKPDQPARYVELRDKAFDLAGDIVAKTPPSREQSLALTHLETAIFFANAAIARHE